MSTLLAISVPIPERVVVVPGGEGFAVRGLSPLHAVALYKRHQGELEPLFEKVIGGSKVRGGAVDEVDLQPLVLGLIAEAPVLMGEIIVLASGGSPADTDTVTITNPVDGQPVDLPKFDAALVLALALPFTTQMDALAKIGELTFTSEMPLGKFVASVLTLISRVAGAAEEMKASLPTAPNGSGASAAQ